MPRKLTHPPTQYNRIELTESELLEKLLREPFAYLKVQDRSLVWSGEWLVLERSTVLYSGKSLGLALEAMS